MRARASGTGVGVCPGGRYPRASVRKVGHLFRGGGHLFVALSPEVRLSGHRLNGIFYLDISCNSEHQNIPVRQLTARGLYPLITQTRHMKVGQTSPRTGVPRTGSSHRRPRRQTLPIWRRTDRDNSNCQEGQRSTLSICIPVTCNIWAKPRPLV